MELEVVEVVLEDVVLHCGIQASSLDKEVISAYFFEISQYLSEWKLIAPKVGLTDDEVAAIEEDNSKAERKRISFLKLWKQKFAMKATYRVLIESLLGIKRVEDARGVCQVLRGEQVYLIFDGLSQNIWTTLSRVASLFLWGKSG